MNGILGMTDLALMTELSTSQRSYLETVKRSGESLLVLLNDLLDLSKIEAGRMELERVEFDVDELTRDAAHVMAPTAFGKGLDLIVRVDASGTPRVQGDPVRLRQVLINLINNAVKFTDNGEIFVNLETQLNDTGENQLHFFVSDTGIGIPEERLALVFEPFRQSDASTTRRFGGTGLGLSICRQLVELMGGRMWVESKLGGGSTFHFCVPLEIAPGTVDKTESHLRGQSVAFVTASTSQGRVWQEWLRDQGALAIVVDHTDALQLLQDGMATNLDLLILDYLPQHAASLQLAEKMQEAAAAQSIPVVALIPADQSASELQAIFDVTLVKPANPTRLSQLLDVTATSSRVSKESIAAPTRTAHPLKILLTDDSLVNQEVGKGLLEMRSHHVTCVSDGQEAVAAATAEQFDVILMDIEMPEIDGPEAARRNPRTVQAISSDRRHDGACSAGTRSR